MNAFLQAFREQEDVQSIVDGCKEHLREQLVTGVSGSSRPLLMATLAKELQRPILIMTHNQLQAQKYFEDVLSVYEEDEVFLYPANEVLATEFTTSSPELRAERLRVLDAMMSGKASVIITPVAGVRRYLPAPADWKRAQLSLTVGTDVDEMDRIKQQLIFMGYERSDMVTTPGEWSLRGGILDVYPLTEATPLRIEFFDTEVDSIRTFSVEDQRSLEKRDSVHIGPAAEWIVRDEIMASLSERLKEEEKASLTKYKQDQQKRALVEAVEYDLERLQQHHDREVLSKYISLVDQHPASLIDYLGDDGVLFLDEWSPIQETIQTLEKDELEWHTGLLEEGKTVHAATYSHKVLELLKGTSRQKVYFSLFLKSMPNTQPQNIVSFSCKPMQQFHGQMHLLKQELDRWKKQGFAVVFTASTEEKAKRTTRVLEDYEMEATYQRSDEPFRKHAAQVVELPLQAGFELPLMKLVVVTESELFASKTKRAPKRKQKPMSNAERIKNYSELQAGDHVVHVHHGIGKYLGIETLTVGGVHKDYLHIRYQGTDKLYVPVEQIDLVQKYVGSEGKEPKLYKLGGSEWKRVKRKVESSVQDIADDLIKLYAERESSKGYAFAPDGDMQREFEANFAYQATEDQLRSIEEIKVDMERERPMDRLLCGDVGYGKTEVAIRAVFKAIADGKQVAFLVPTTILAQQHFETMRERFQDFPIEVRLMSRFRTRKEQQETAKGLKNGTVDVVVGTHRLLSKDMVYHDLGLLIIDEEQRFGVTHKEKIKQFKTNIDVLTLTATPIPRTLHMSMLGVRDLSVIETPPENRFPVQTYVMEYNGPLVREAIERELARQGQVYFLYNRVEDIERKAEEISMLVPDARVAYAHGRMTENELESVILRFIEGEFDVLVSTTIIETGVDIPNVNTLLVFDADRMGLSQLYQLRGRVGRTNRVAYAYFTYRKDKVLTEVAENRLHAIKEFTELGSGFKIAMRDLSIRGAGNLLGAQQHGFIDSVGFDLYSQMLKEAIEERKGGVSKQEKESIEIDVKVDAYLPDRYIGDGQQKIEMYKRFRSVKTPEDVEELEADLIDRFGEPTSEVRDLVTIAHIRAYGLAGGVKLLEQKGDTIHVYLTENHTAQIDGARLFEETQNLGRDLGIGMEGPVLHLSLNYRKQPSSEWLPKLASLVKTIFECKKEPASTHAS